MTACDFSSTNMTAWKFSSDVGKVKLNGCSFDRSTLCSLPNANFSHSSFRCGIIESINISDCDFSGCYLAGVCFNKTNISSSVFDAANLSNATILGNHRKVSFGGALLLRTRIIGDLVDSEFFDSEITDSILQCTFRACSFAGMSSLLQLG